jgi:hypothetical protein
LIIAAFVLIFCVAIVLKRLNLYYKDEQGLDAKSIEKTQRLMFPPEANEIILFCILVAIV